MAWADLQPTLLSGTMHTKIIWLGAVGMSFVDYVVNIMLSVILIIGAYQFYFWCQRQQWCKARSFHSPLDEKIPFWPSWVWVYSFLYYPAIVYLNLLAKDPRQFNYMAISFIALLFLQMVFFLLYPVETPAHWRALPDSSRWSIRFLKFVQYFDKSSNCFPSMHTSVAMLTALFAWPQFGAWGLAFPTLIGISCMFTKQHYLLDLPAGAALGWGVYEMTAFCLPGFCSTLS